VVLLASYVYRVAVSFNAPAATLNPHSRSVSLTNDIRLPSKDDA